MTMLDMLWMSGELDDKHTNRGATDQVPMNTCRDCGNMGNAESWPFVHERDDADGSMLCADCWNDVYGEPSETTEQDD